MQDSVWILFTCSKTNIFDFVNLLLTRLKYLKQNVVDVRIEKKQYSLDWILKKLTDE
jgi:ribonuclease D